MSDRAVMSLSDYDSACDKVREKTETTDLIKSGELAERVDEVYEAGRAQGEREMWDNITNYNTISSYESRFIDWGGEYIRPPYKLNPTAKRSLYCTFNSARSVKKIEKNHFDFSQKEKGTTAQEGLYYTFFHCDSVEEIEDIGIQADFSMTHSYSNCRKLKKIECVRVDENTKYSNTFEAAEALESVTFEGVIGQNGLNLQSSKKLSKASFMNTVMKLSPHTTGLSITFSLASVKKAFETSEGANDGDTSEAWLSLIGRRQNWGISLI